MQGMRTVPCDNIQCSVFYNKIVAKDKIEQINKKLEKAIESIEDEF